MSTAGVITSAGETEDEQSRGPVRHGSERDVEKGTACSDLPVTDLDSKE